MQSDEHDSPEAPKDPSRKSQKRRPENAGGGDDDPVRRVSTESQLAGGESLPLGLPAVSSLPFVATTLSGAA